MSQHVILTYVNHQTNVADLEESEAGGVHHYGHVEQHLDTEQAGGQHPQQGVKPDNLSLLTLTMKTG